MNLSKFDLIKLDKKLNALCDGGREYAYIDNDNYLSFDLNFYVYYVLPLMGIKNAHPKTKKILKIMGFASKKFQIEIINADNI